MAKRTKNLFGTESINMSHTQQGDVLLHPIANLPKGLEISHNPILQHGEHTGHKHMLTFRHDGKRAGSGIQFEVLTNKKTGERFLNLKEVSDLVHEEHKTITIEPGLYRIGIVQEYDHFAEEARQVQD